MLLYQNNPSHEGILNNAVLMLSLEVCRELGIQASHPTLDVLHRVLRRRLEQVYALGLTGYDQLHDESTQRGEAQVLRYIPAAGEPGDVPVSGERAFVQFPVGEHKKV